MRTRSQSRHNSPQQEASPVIVEPLRIELPFLEDQFQEDPPPEVPMADNQTTAELLQAPTEGYKDAIVILEIAANNFELKHASVSSPTPASVKAVEPNCVTYVGTHSYQNCPATRGNFYRDNIQEYVSQAAAANYNQGNTGFRPQMVANQIRPPSQLHRPQVNQPPAYQALAYQALIPQTQSVSQTNFKSYVKANDAVLRNMQNQGQNVQNQLANLTNMLFEFMSSNTTSSSGSGTLPSNTITTPKEELKGFTTRSDVAYQGPTIPTPSKVVKQGTEVTKDQVQTPSSQSTEPVQPPVSQSETPTPISKPVVTPVSASIPNVKSSILYPSRRDNERRRDQANDQIEKFHEIFKDMSFEISFTDALILMPKFASTLKALIRNKEKLSEMARTLMNEHCLAVILNKLPRKLGDPDKFLIPCEFPGMDECLALADLGASINLMPFSVWEALSLSELTSTWMTLKLADRSVSKPIGIAKDVSFKVELKVCEEKTVKSFIDKPPEVELKDLPPHLEYAFLEGDNKLPVIIAKELRDEEKSVLIKVLKSHKRAIAWKLSDIQEVEKLLDAGLIYLISDNPWVSPVHCVPKKGGFTVVENEENELILTRLVIGWRVCIDYRKLNEATRKDHFPLPFMDQMLERLAEMNSIISSMVSLGTFQRCMLAIFHDMVEKTMEVFMDDFLVFRNSFENCLSRLDKMLQRCEDTNLSLNWEKSHFMVKEGIVLDHKISKNRIDFDRAKVDVIPKLPHPTTVKGTKVTKDQVQTPSSQETAPVQPSVIQSESQASVSEPVVAPVSAPIPNLKPSIPYPSRHDNEKCRDQANE
nr:reverse transcriptase domain-containing protein [Tanacetum cinerariifolium]